MKRLRINCFPPRADNNDWFLIPTIRLSVDNTYSLNETGWHCVKRCYHFRVLFLKFVWVFLMVNYTTKEGIIPEIKIRLATSEEKQWLLDKIHEKGIDWDAEKKQLVDWRWKPKNSSKKYGFSKSGKYGPIYFVRGDAKNERGVRYALSLIGVQAETWTYNINGVGFMPIEDGYLYFGYRGSRLMRVPIDQQSWLPQIIMDTAIELQPTPPERIPSHFFEDTEEE